MVSTVLDVAVAAENGARAIASRDAPDSLSQIDCLHKSSAAKVLEASTGTGVQSGDMNPAAVEAAAALLASASEDRTEATGNERVLRDVAIVPPAPPGHLGKDSGLTTPRKGRGHRQEVPLR